MPAENPYDAPQNLDRREPPSFRVLMASVGVVILTATVGGILGTIIGALLGRFNPGYFRFVFVGGDDPTFDPFAVGVALGLGQGTGLGAATGVVLVALFYWYRTRIARIDAGHH